MRLIMSAVALAAALIAPVAIAKSKKTSDDAPSLTLASTTVLPGKSLRMNQVFNSFGCSGKNLSPQLSWSGVPKDAKSLAITVFDPDAPTGSGWWHWVVFNIPATVTSLPEGASRLKMPKGAVESLTDYGKQGFGGACPPEGDEPHRYIFTVWALNTDTLPLDGKATGAMVGYYLNQHRIATAGLEATYSR